MMRQKKSVLTFLLAVALVLQMFCGISVSALEIDPALQNGEIYNNVPRAIMLQDFENCALGVLDANLMQQVNGIDYSVGENSATEGFKAANVVEKAGALAVSDWDPSSFGSKALELTMSADAKAQLAYINFLPYQYDWSKFSKDFNNDGKIDGYFGFFINSTELGQDAKIEINFNLENNDVWWVADWANADSEKALTTSWGASTGMKLISYSGLFAEGSGLSNILSPRSYVMVKLDPENFRGLSNMGFPSDNGGRIDFSQVKSVTIRITGSDAVKDKKVYIDNIFVGANPYLEGVDGYYCNSGLTLNGERLINSRDITAPVVSLEKNSVRVAQGSFFNIDKLQIVEDSYIGNYAWENTLEINVLSPAGEPVELVGGTGFNVYGNTGDIYTVTYTAKDGAGNTSQTKLKVKVVQKSVGDINGNLHIEITDMILLKNHLLGKTKLEGYLFEGADLDSNSEINILDICKLKDLILDNEFINSALYYGNKYRGGVVCDYIPYRYWAGSGQKYDGVDFIQTMKDNGMNSVRVGVTTLFDSRMESIPAEYWKNLPWDSAIWSNRESALQILKEAQSKGMSANLFLFLSDRDAHAGVQEIPETWKDASGNITIESLCQHLEAYCYETVSYFINKGIDIDVYEIGNEINAGILEYRPGERIDVPYGVDVLNDIEFLSNNVWNIEAELLKAAIKGVKRANPDAVIGLHVAGVGMTRDDHYVKHFFRVMNEHNVEYDIAGLSYYWYNVSRSEPTAPYYTTESFSDLVDYLGDVLNKKVLISEFAYPASTEGIDTPNDIGYNFTEQGQADWIRDFLDYIEKNDNILGSYYFYPEYYDGLTDSSDSILEACGLMKNSETPLAALNEYKEYLYK